VEKEICSHVLPENGPSEGLVAPMPVSDTRCQDMRASPATPLPSVLTWIPGRTTHSFMNTSALVGSVNISPEISLTPASPPSSRPSSTSVEMPWATHLLMKGTAMAMFSSSVYTLIRDYFWLRKEVRGWTYIGVGSIHHDGIKLDPLCLGETNSQFEVLSVSRVVKVDSNGDRSVVRADTCLR